MKLLSLYVDNFGKLSDFSYDFSSELNSFYEENGWGKTTLTVFIKSMLYGLMKNERTIYAPWKNISSFGGYLVLEANGKTYRIERQFSTAKASLDTFKIFDLKTNSAHVRLFFLVIQINSIMSTDEFTLCTVPAQALSRFPGIYARTFTA
jgi:recombinational DNA repair ATPase RecF